MKCFDHPDADAAGLCPRCNRGLCHGCVARFSPMMCEPCFVTNNRDVAMRTAIRLAVTFLAFAGGVALGASQAQTRAPIESGLVMGAALVCLLWGWFFSGDRSSQSSFFVALSPLGWCIFLFFRLVFAGVVGLFAAPWGIVTGVIELVRIRRTRREIRAGMI